MKKILYADSNYSDLYSDYSEYDYLSGIWEDFKSGISSVAKAVAGVVKPVAPELIYRGVTGEARPPERIVRQPIIMKPTFPTWVIPAGIGVLALFLLKGRKA